MARELKTSYQNPILYRLNQFIDHHNQSYNSDNSMKKELGKKIRCGKKGTATVLFLSYFNKNKEELLNWGDKDTDFLPSVFTNNVEISERLTIEDTTTAWRNVEWLCALDLPDGLGKFMTKEFHGRKSDYQIRINPFFLCGKVVLNWGKACKNLEKVEQSPENEIALETALNSPLIAKCNPPTFSKTIIDYKTTTTACGKVENITSTQKQQTKTKGGSIGLLTSNQTTKSPVSKTIKGGGGGGDVLAGASVIAPTSWLSGVRGKGQSETQNQEPVSEEITQNVKYQAIRAYGLDLVTQFFEYSTQTLYPTYRFSKKETSKIKNIMWNSWYWKGIHADLSKESLDKHQETMLELVTIALQEVASNQWSYIHADPKKFFSHTFEHGLVRASTRFKQRKINRDTALIITAQKSVKLFKIPRGVKTIHTLPQLIRYWQHRLETTTYDAKTTLKAFNIFLTNPKNLYKL